MTRTEQERIAILETEMRALHEQNSRMEKTQSQMQSDVRYIKETLATAKGWRLGFLTALPALGGGGVGAALVKFFGSGGTGTH